MVVLLAALVLAAPAAPARSRAKKPPAATPSAIAPQKAPLCEGDYADAVPPAAASQVLEIWKAEFDGSYRAGGCFLLVVHPFCIGRHPRIAMLGELIEYIEGFPDVWFATHLEVAEEWRRLQVEQGTWDHAVALRAD